MNSNTYTAIRISHEEQDKAIRIFELRIRITFTNKTKGWKLEKAIRIIKLLIQITPLMKNLNIAKVIRIT